VGNGVRNEAERNESLLGKLDGLSEEDLGSVGMPCDNSK